MKNSALLLCLGLDGIGAYFASLTVEDWLRLLLVTLSLLSLLASFIIKGISIVKNAKEKKEDPDKTAESLLEEAQKAADEAKEILEKNLKKEEKLEKKTSIYRIKEK